MILPVIICAIVLFAVVYYFFNRSQQASQVLKVFEEKLNHSLDLYSNHQAYLKDALTRYEQELKHFHEANADKQVQLQTLLNEKLAALTLLFSETKHELKQQVSEDLAKFREQINTQQSEFIKTHVDISHASQNTLQNGVKDLRENILATLKNNTDTIHQSVNTLKNNVESHLKEISGQVEKRLTDGFEKTTATFTEILTRLSLIDEAQKKITELSVNVVSLQNILSDKTSRGAFGEVQLSGLIHNMLPEKNFALQHTLQNGKRVDCMLFLPEPSGNIAIDAKFPLENYQEMIQAAPGEDFIRKTAEQKFRQMVKKHIQDIAEKYIIPGETAEGAVMFIPAEAIFAEIHSHFMDVVDYAHERRVWLVSPTTMMAILTTARAVLKDEATREQVHIIQEHLRGLSKDFSRFQSRMDSLAKHINQANDDVTQVHISAKKITSRFNKIEKVEVLENTNKLLEVEEDE